MIRVCAALLWLVTLALEIAVAQGTTAGHVGVFGDYFPNRADTTELRARLFVEQKVEPSPPVRMTLSGFAEGLVARRPEVSPETDGILRVQDANLELRAKRVDLLAGYARVAWGKLDEIQPTDVVNPLDVSRFFFEGRSEARLPVLLMRGRVHVSDNVAIEGIYVPDFRRGRFDQLAEPSSPFNIVAGVECPPTGCPALPATIVDRQPPFTARNGQGGGRMSATTGRVDWSVSAYRGFEPFGLYRLETIAGPVPGVPPPALVLDYPRFTMIGADFEAVRGAWGMRGELAAFVDDSFQSPDLQILSGNSVDGGVGFDRRAGDYTVSGTVLFHVESYDPGIGRAETDGRSDVSLVLSVDRTFARERYRLRAFGVFNATESSGFTRVIGMANLRDNFALEASIGWFAGEGRDLVGRFGDSDFAYLRARYYF